MRGMARQDNGGARTGMRSARKRLHATITLLCPRQLAVRPIGAWQRM